MLKLLQIFIKMTFTFLDHKFLLFLSVHFKNLSKQVPLTFLHLIVNLEISALLFKCNFGLVFSIWFVLALNEIDTLLFALLVRFTFLVRFVFFLLLLATFVLEFTLVAIRIRVITYNFESILLVATFKATLVIWAHADTSGPITSIFNSKRVSFHRALSKGASHTCQKLSRMLLRPFALNKEKMGAMSIILFILVTISIVRLEISNCKILFSFNYHFFHCFVALSPFLSFHYSRFLLF